MNGTETANMIKEVKAAFLTNIGKVIEKYRTKHGWTQDRLGKELGVVQTQVGRYEHGEDIKASTMAHISVLLSFPMKEYVTVFRENRMPFDEQTPVDIKFEEIIRYITKPKSQASPQKDNLPPKPSLRFDYAAYAWKMEEPIIVEPAKTPLPTQEELRQSREFFREYMENEDNFDKRELVDYVMNIIANAETKGYPKGNTKALARAAAGFIISDCNKACQRRLLAYKQGLESVIRAW